VKRTEFKRRTPMRQRRVRAEGPTAAPEVKPWAAALAGASLKPLRVASYQGGTSGERVEKENALQHQGYMAAVRDLGYCMLCRRSCRPQFCHADMGKGERIKTDVRRGWPGCGAGEWGPGCHWLVGTSGQYPKEERRALEAELARRTREAVKAAGAWPAHLPMWREPDPS
jgi:hypothetical protein